jgi:hypothetical protein
VGFREEEIRLTRPLDGRIHYPGRSASPPAQNPCNLTTT